MIGACGLICDECSIFQASNNPKIAQQIVDWLKSEMNIEVRKEDIRCSGCKGNRAEHWSPDCWILKCCVDDKGLEYCSQCEVFPCEKLVERSKESERYKDALNRLRNM